MQLLADGDVLIHRPVDEVFAYASNLENFADWFPGVLAIQSNDSLPHGQVGKQYVETVSLPLRGPRKILITVRESQLGQCVVTEGELSPILPRMEIRVTAAGNGVTHFRWQMHSRSRSAVVKALLLPLARRVMHRRAAVGMTRLKKLLETTQ